MLEKDRWTYAQSSQRWCLGELVLDILKFAAQQQFVLWIKENAHEVPVYQGNIILYNAAQKGFVNPQLTSLLHPVPEAALH